MDCFAATTSHSTVPYFTLNTPRQITLAYTEAGAHPRPVVSADVALLAGSATPTYYALAATLNGVKVTFLTGDTTVYFSGSSSAVRLSGQFDASSQSTGVYSLVVTVTAMFPDGTTKSHSYTRSLVVVNEAHSPLARGWTVAGLARLYILGSGYLVTNGAGDAVFYPTLGVAGPDFATLTYDGGTLTYTRTDVTGTRMVFNSAGFMTGIWDRRGLGTTMAYDAQHRLQYVYDPMFVNTTASRYLVLQYGTYGLSAIQDHGGPGPTRTTVVTVGADSNLTAIMDPDSASVHYTYDTSNRLSTDTDRRGGVTTYLYDSHSWKLSTVKLPQVPVDAGSGATHDSIPVVSYQPWQTIGVPIVATSVSSLATPALKSAIRARVVDARGQPTWFVPNRWGQPVQAGDTLGNTQTTTYQGYFPIVVQHVDGRVDSATYSGALVTSVRLAGKPRRYYRYGVFGQVDSTWGNGAPVERYYLHSTTGNVDSVKTAGVTLNMERLTYDAQGRLTVDVDPSGHTRRWRYDAVFGNVDSTSVPSGAGPRVRFDAFGRDSTIRLPGSATQRVLYDVMNRPIKRYDGVSATPEQITYDALFTTSVRDRNGNVTTYAPNAAGRVTQRCDALSACATYRYDAGNLLTSYTNRRGQRVSLTYDAIGRLTSKSGTNVSADSFSYSPNGLIAVAHNSVETDSTIVTPGTSTVGASTKVITWLDGTRHQIVHGDLQSWAGKDSTVITASTSVTFKSQYLVADTLTGNLLSHNDGFQTTTYSYTDERLRASLTTSYGSKLENYTVTHQKYQDLITPAPGVSIDGVRRFYHYDANMRVDNLAWITNPAPGNAKLQYAYDSAGRLAQSQLRGSCTSWTSDTVYGSKCDSAVTTTTYTYGYDSVGNWINNRGFGPANRLASTTFYDASYSYDADGNLVSRSHSQLLWPADSGNFLYTWSADGRLLSSSHDGQPAVYYDYNAYGQPVRKWHGNPASGGTLVRRYLYDRGQRIAEFDATASNHRVAEYVYETDVDRPYGLILGATTPTQIQYYFQDELGDVIGLVASGTVKQAVTYTDWGIPTVTGDTTSRLLWKGLPYDPETRLYYVRNRWYSADIALFLSEDPAGFVDGLNLYTFAGDDPINGRDPSGLWAYVKGDPNFDPQIGIGSFLHKLLHARGRKVGRISVLVVGSNSGKGPPSGISRIVNKIGVIIALAVGTPTSDKTEEPKTEDTEQVEPDKKPSAFERYQQASQKFHDMVDSIMDSFLRHLPPDLGHPDPLGVGVGTGIGAGGVGLGAGSLAPFFLP